MPRHSTAVPSCISDAGRRTVQKHPLRQRRGLRSVGHSCPPGPPLQQHLVRQGATCPRRRPWDPPRPGPSCRGCRCSASHQQTNRSWCPVCHHTRSVFPLVAMYQHILAKSQCCESHPLPRHTSGLGLPQGLPLQASGAAQTPTGARWLPLDAGRRSKPASATARSGCCAGQMRHELLECACIGTG